MSLKLTAQGFLKIGWLEDDTSFFGAKSAYFRWRAVSFRGCKSISCFFVSTWWRVEHPDTWHSHESKEVQA